MPVNVTIRAVPDDVHQRLAARAAAAGQSLQHYLTDELTRIAARPTTREALQRMREGLRGFAPVEISASEIVGHAEADRR